MTLQFDPSPYLAAFKIGQQDQQANQQRPFQEIQSIGDIAQGIQRNQQGQQNDRYKQLQAYDPSLTPEANAARMKYLATGELPSYEHPDIPEGSSSNSLSQANPNPSSLPQNGQMVSAGMPDTGWGQESQPSQMPQLPQPPQPQMPQMNQQPSMGGSPIVAAHKDYLSKQSQGQSQGQPQGIASLFAKKPFDVNSEIGKMKGGDYSGMANYTPGELKTIEATPAYTDLKRKQEVTRTPDEVAALLNLDDSHASRLKSQFPNGISEKDIPYISSGLKMTATMGTKESNQQDKLEQQARQSVTNLRGDKSLARAEEQRDAAIVAYNRIQEIEKQGGQLNPIDYTDILGQIYKARTGAAPTEQVLGEIRQATAKGSFGKAYTYITGQQAPATTEDIKNSLKQMAQSMGQQADKFHEGYMKSHLIKPKGLEDGRWQPILSTGRGQSFQEATQGGGEMGVKAGAATHRWNPQTGQVEVIQ